MKITFIHWLLILIAVELPSFAQSTPAPTLTCTVEQTLDAPSGTPVTYDVSNINLITMDVAINLQGGQLNNSGSIAINPPSNNLPTSYLVITATNSSGTSVPVNAKITKELNGTGGYGITFFLPQDAATRTAAEQARLNSAIAADGTTDPNNTAWAQANNAKALAAIDQIYTQSQVGAFTITVTYVSTQSGVWNGTVAGTPIVVNVENEGSQLANLPN